MGPLDLGPLSPPPADLTSRDLVVAAWNARLFRVHRAGVDAVHVGTSRRNRLDDPVGEYGVLYASADLEGGFIETFGAISSISVNSLAATGWSVIEGTRPWRLCDLRGNGLARVGADGRLCTGNRDDAQHWSRAIWAHPSMVDGICYPARTNLATTSVALFDRVAATVGASYQGSFMDAQNQGTTARLLEHYRIGLLPG